MGKKNTKRRNIMSKELIKLINDNPDLPIFAWVDYEIVGGDYGSWAGQFGDAEIREYAKVETYGWDDRDYVFKDEPEDYIEYLLNKNEDMSEEEAERQIRLLEYKKAIFVYINIPKDF